MKNINLSILFSIFFLSAAAQNYQISDSLSTVKFTIKNFGFNVTGTVKGLDGLIGFNPSNPSTAFFKVTLKTNTVNTGMKSRDAHLRKDDFFDVVQFPQISFVSKQVVESSAKGTFVITGVLNMKGISKEISFPFTVIKINEGLLFKGDCKLNRRDFQIGGSSIVLSDNLVISLNVIATGK